MGNGKEQNSGQNPQQKKAAQGCKFSATEAVHSSQIPVHLNALVKLMLELEEASFGTFHFLPISHFHITDTHQKKQINKVLLDITQLHQYSLEWHFFP